MSTEAIDWGQHGEVATANDDDGIDHQHPLWGILDLSSEDASINQNLGHKSIRKMAPCPIAFGICLDLRLLFYQWHYICHSWHTHMHCQSSYDKHIIFDAPPIYHHTMLSNHIQAVGPGFLGNCCVLVGPYFLLWSNDSMLSMPWEWSGDNLQQPPSLAYMDLLCIPMFSQFLALSRLHYSILWVEKLQSINRSGK